jgi:uncharacterized protein YdeI (YjbR/CyaY-like superfamily)
MSVSIGETIYPKTISEWRAWLNEHHSSKAEIWIIYYKNHTGKPTLHYQDAVDVALCFGWIDGIEKRLDDERYVQRFSPRRLRSSWSETNVARYNALLEDGKMTSFGTQAFERRVPKK